MNLKLMQVFHAVYAEGSVSRAAERMGLSQPAISHALRRLREELRDPLFLRVPGGVAPTAKAERLAIAVAQSMQILELAIKESSHFDPATSKRAFRLYLTDIGALMLLPKLMEALRLQAPNISLEVDQLPLEAIMPALETGALDMAMGYLPILNNCQHRILFRERYVVFLRGDHPLLQRPVTDSTFKQLEYALVRSHSETRRQLNELQLESNRRLTLPHFMALPAILAHCNLATLIPSRLAKYFQGLGNFKMLDLTTNSLPIDVGLHWFWRFDHDPGHRWLREKIVELLAEQDDA